MVSGPDIITYIGVPLAVLGVMPIIYNTITTLLTLAKVRRMLRHSRLVGIARGDVVNHVIEVELPRYTIAPLHREEQCKDYWSLYDYPSLIPGGTWTTFNWRRHNTGLKTQRIDYSDQLRLPQAEIEFEELISFLLDLGAVPDAAGFRMLRGSGLWVPTGTPLLVSPNRHEPVLTIAPLDDSDGHLSLAVRWSSTWGMRDQSSLPPYWVLIKDSLTKSPEVDSETTAKPPLVEEEGQAEAPTTKRDSASRCDSGNTDEQTLNGEGQRSSTPEVKRTSKYNPSPPEEQSPSIRCQIGTTGLTTAIPHIPSDPQLFSPLPISHLQTSSNPTSTWFASAITALSTSSSTILWNYKIPTPILTFSQTPTIPCGILVLLSFIPESSTPEWATQYHDSESASEIQLRRMREQSRAMMKENLMNPQDKAVAVRERQIKTHEQWVQDLNDNRRRDAQRAEQRIIEAVQSPKWDNRLVGQHCLAWLKDQKIIDENHDIKRVVEALLCKMVMDTDFAGDICGVLDKWKAFGDNGGLKKVDYLELLKRRELFAQAGLLVAIIKETVSAGHGSLADDLQECLRIWRKVRLG